MGYEIRNFQEIFGITKQKICNYKQEFVHNSAKMFIAKAMVYVY